MRRHVATFVGVMMSSGINAQDNEFSVPLELAPVSQWSEGFTNKESEQFRERYSASDYVLGNDLTAFAYLNITEVITTMMVYREGPVALLESRSMPQIGRTIARTKLGAITLDEAVVDERSRIQGIAVAHKGQLALM